MVRTLWVRWISAFAILVALPGCRGNDQSTVSASGKVQVEGQDVSGLVITLQPIAPTTGPKATVPVFGGEFTIGPEAGLHGGQYRVRFSVMPAEILSQLPEDKRIGLVPAGQFVTRAFDVDSQLKWRLDRGEANENNFDVELE